MRVPALLGGLLLVIGGGCASTSRLESGCAHFYQGEFDQAVEHVASEKPPRNNQVRFYMERGLFYQEQGDYRSSSRDLIEAFDRSEDHRNSLSRGGASMVINDEMLAFTGLPYEQTLLHAYTAKNHLGLAHWNDAGVEARRMIRSLSPEYRGDYPDSAYARYLAGFILELQGDYSNAEVQFRTAGSMLQPELFIDERSGRLREKRHEPVSPLKDGEGELVCFVGIGRSLGSSEEWGRAVSPASAAYAKFYHGETYLGRSYPFSDTVDLRFTTEQHRAARKSIKTAVRVGIKEAIAEGVEDENGKIMGDLTRLFLLGLLEHPDTRHWSTLPRSLQVARFPCPKDLDAYRVEFVNTFGSPVGGMTVKAPLQRHRDIHVSFCRDLPRKPPVEVEVADR